MNSLSLTLLIASALLAAAGQLLLKTGVDGREQLVNFFNTTTFLGLGCYLIGMLLWIYVLSKESISSVYAFTALTFVLVMLGSVVFLNEQLSLSSTVGSAVVLIGLIIIIYQPLQN